MAGLTKGFLAIGLWALMMCLVWPPLTAGLLKTAIKEREWKLAILAVFAIGLQATVVGGLLYWIAT